MFAWIVLFLGYQSGHALLIDELIKAASPGWEKRKHWHENISCLCHNSFNATLQNGSKLSLPEEGKFRFMRKGNNTLLEYKIANRGTGKYSEGVLVNGPKYSFHLERKEKPEWFISQIIFTHDTAIEEKIDNYFQRRFMQSCKMYKIENNVYVRDCNVDTITMPIHNNNLATVKGSMLTPVAGKSQEKVKVEMTFDSLNLWALSLYNYESSKSSSTTKLEYNTTTLNGIQPILRITFRQKNNGDGEFEQVFNYSEIDTNQINDSVFLLSNYGFKEPQSIQADNPMPWSIYISTAGILFIVFAIFIARKRTMNASINAKPLGQHR